MRLTICLFSQFIPRAIAELSQDENELGRFLKRSGKADKTQAGKMMAAVGRAETFTAQQRYEATKERRKSIKFQTVAACASCAPVRRVRSVHRQGSGRL